MAALTCLQDSVKMPSKKKKYNARFPPARIKKIMQTDEDVGKVAAAVPVIISRALELFIETLIVKSSETTRSKNAKTLSTQHIKQTILAEHQFDFLRDLVQGIPDVQVNEDDETAGSASIPPTEVITSPTPDEAASTSTEIETQAPRPRGRPKKPQSSEDIAKPLRKSQPSEDSSGPPRKRGRPPKWKPTTDESASEDAEAEAADNDQDVKKWLLSPFDPPELLASTSSSSSSPPSSSFSSLPSSTSASIMSQSLPAAAHGAPMMPTHAVASIHPNLPQVPSGMLLSSTSKSGPGHGPLPLNVNTPSMISATSNESSDSPADQSSTVQHASDIRLDDTNISWMTSSATATAATPSDQSPVSLSHSPTGIISLGHGEPITSPALGTSQMLSVSSSTRKPHICTEPVKQEMSKLGASTSYLSAKQVPLLDMQVPSASAPDVRECPRSPGLHVHQHPHVPFASADVRYPGMPAPSHLLSATCKSGSMPTHGHISHPIPPPLNPLMTSNHLTESQATAHSVKTSPHPSEHYTDRSISTAVSLPLQVEGSSIPSSIPSMQNPNTSSISQESIPQRSTKCLDTNVQSTSVHPHQLSPASGSSGCLGSPNVVTGTHVNTSMTPDLSLHQSRTLHPCGSQEPFIRNTDMRESLEEAKVAAGGAHAAAWIEYQAQLARLPPRPSPRHTLATPHLSSSNDSGLSQSIYSVPSGKNSDYDDRCQEKQGILSGSQPAYQNEAARQNRLDSDEVRKSSSSVSKPGHKHLEIDSPDGMRQYQYINKDPDMHSDSSKDKDTSLFKGKPDPTSEQVEKTVKHPAKVVSNVSLEWSQSSDLGVSSTASAEHSIFSDKKKELAKNTGQMGSQIEVNGDTVIRHRTPISRGTELKTDKNAQPSREARQDRVAELPPTSLILGEMRPNLSRERLNANQDFAIDPLESSKQDQLRDLKHSALGMDPSSVDYYRNRPSTESRSSKVNDIYLNQAYAREAHIKADDVAYPAVIQDSRDYQTGYSRLPDVVPHQSAVSSEASHSSHIPSAVHSPSVLQPSHSPHLKPVQDVQVHHTHSSGVVAIGHEVRSKRSPRLPAEAPSLSSAGFPSPYTGTSPYFPHMLPSMSPLQLNHLPPYIQHPDFHLSPLYAPNVMSSAGTAAAKLGDLPSRHFSPLHPPGMLFPGMPPHIHQFMMPHMLPSLSHSPTAMGPERLYFQPPERSSIADTRLESSEPLDMRKSTLPTPSTNSSTVHQHCHP